MAAGPWIKHDGSAKCPVDPTTKVQVVNRKETPTEGGFCDIVLPAGYWEWGSAEGASLYDIVYWRLADAQSKADVPLADRCAKHLPDPSAYPAMPGIPVPEVTELRRSTDKLTNPKDAIGSRKVPKSVVPQNVMALVACGLAEGAGKYGRHNYRGAGVRASVYYDGNARHMDDWWEGEDIDPDSLLHHVIKAICSNIVLADSILRGTMTDDRPPPSPTGWMQAANAHASRMVDKANAFAEKHGAPHHWTIADIVGASR